MKGKILGIAVIVVALGVLVNALALSSATVSNNAVNIPIVATNSALIAVQGGTDGDITFGTDATGKQAKMTVSTGLQADSSYTFDSAFQVTNNSSSATKISIPNTITVSGVTVTLTDSAGAAITNTSVPAGNSLGVKMAVAVPAGQAASSGLSFVFSISGSK